MTRRCFLCSRVYTFASTFKDILLFGAKAIGTPKLQTWIRCDLRETPLVQEPNTGYMHHGAARVVCLQRNHTTYTTHYGSFVNKIYKLF
jgi:hypothetical protein